MAEEAPPLDNTPMPDPEAPGASPEQKAAAWSLLEEMTQDLPRPSGE